MDEDETLEDFAVLMAPPELTGRELGRDELNLAEFPLAVLADRVPDGQKTLVFEDRIWDAGKKQTITRKLTISASDKYGLPTALDDDVILGLIQLTKQSRFADRKVSFSRYQLIQTLGWRHEGKSYARLETSLKRWLGVTLYYDKAWWDKEAQSWVDENFHILDQVTLYDQERRLDKLRRRSHQADLPLSFFTWNEVVFRSFESGYLKALDHGFYRRLGSLVSKRMYRFLDKRFYHKQRREFDLEVFACEHIGLGRNYDTGQLKRRLQPAIDELEALGFLALLAPAERFVRVARGKWRVVLVRQAHAPKAIAVESPHDPVVAKLVDRGVSSSVAKQLVRDFPTNRIEAQIAAFDSKDVKSGSKAIRNPGGYLAQAIREDFMVSAAPAPNKPHPVAPRANRPKHGPGGKSVPVKEPDDRNDAVEKYLNSLTSEEFASLEAAAIRGTDPVVAEGYERSKQTGGATHRAYRQMLFAGHVPSPA